MSMQHIDKIQKEIAANLKKKTTLSSFNQMLFEKNYNLYLKHEVMLDEEKAKRSVLAEAFQGKMAEITEKLNA